MLYILLTLTFIAGVLIRGIIIHLPTLLQQSWAKECVSYLQSHALSPDNFDALPGTQQQRIIWWHYVPFSSLLWKNKNASKLGFLILDSVLFVSALLIFYHFDNYLYWGSALLFTWLLLSSSFIDFEHQILPDELTYILLWMGLLCSCWNLYTYSSSAILGALVAYLSLFIISLLFKFIKKKEGIGQGDLKLFAAIIAWTGITYVPLVLFFASLFSLVFILLRKIIFDQAYAAPVSFGPFLALSGWLILLWGSDVMSYVRL